jgi:hypothetical protein
VKKGAPTESGGQLLLLQGDHGPSSPRVARKLSQSGNLDKLHAVARWRTQGWRPLAVTTAKDISGDAATKDALHRNVLANCRERKPRGSEQGNMSPILPKSPQPIFKPREIIESDMSHWYVEVEWADGTIDEIGEFKSISEAWDWIARQSRAWLEERGS